MANQSIQRSHNLGIKTVIVSKERQRFQGPVSIKRPAPTAKSTAEKAAEHWVAARLFEHYNS